MAAPAPTPAELEQGLLTLAVCGGNAAEAMRHGALLEPPVKWTESKLRAWKRKYAARYAEIQQEHVASIEAIVLQQVREAIIQAGALQARVLEKLLVAVEGGDLEAKDLANILKSAGVSLGINVEKMLLLTNRPTSIAETRDVAELIQSLAQRVPGLIVGSAEEITDVRGIDEGRH